MPRSPGKNACLLAMPCEWLCIHSAANRAPDRGRKIFNTVSRPIWALLPKMGKIESIKEGGRGRVKHCFGKDIGYTPRDGEDKEHSLSQRVLHFSGRWVKRRDVFDFSTTHTSSPVTARLATDISKRSEMLNKGLHF